MNIILYIDRLTKKKEKEKVYGGFFLELLYGKTFLSRCLSPLLLPLFSKIPFGSYLYGFLQKSRLSKRKIRPFIQKFKINTSEFLEPISAFSSFNDFFIRKLKKESRPFDAREHVAILPADARYLVFQHIDEMDGFWIKGKKLSLKQLLQNEPLARRYKKGAMAIARLCPTDYHRFHFPFDCTPTKAKLINGPLYSVNPIALKRNIKILSENKRMITTLQTSLFHQVLFIEVGATHVGTIKQTYKPDMSYKKGAEKGYFSFGGSCLILLFEPNTILFDQDLVEASLQKIEVRGLLGQSLGTALR